METNSELNLWVKEIHKDIAGLSFKIEKTLFSGKSKFQQIDVVQTTNHGAMLLNDGIIMLSERDEFIYHEMIAHVPLFVHPCPKRVLIIGGGDGGSAREVLKHSEVKQVVMVEIDEMVVNVCKKYLQSVSCALDDPRLNLVIEDGVEFVANTDEKFDIVIVDSTDPVGPALPLFNRDFYKNVANILTEHGILISQAESPFYDNDIQKPMLENQRPFFSNLHLYLFTNMTYPGGLWSFGYASKGLSPIKDFKPSRVESSTILNRYYNSEIHKAAFVLPTFLKDSLAGILDPLKLK